MNMVTSILFLILSISAQSQEKIIQKGVIQLGQNSLFDGAGDGAGGDRWQPMGGEMTKEELKVQTERASICFALHGLLYQKAFEQTNTYTAKGRLQYIKKYSGAICDSNLSPQDEKVTKALEGLGDVTLLGSMQGIGWKVDKRFMMFEGPEQYLYYIHRSFHLPHETELRKQVEEMQNTALQMGEIRASLPWVPYVMATHLLRGNYEIASDLLVNQKR